MTTGRENATPFFQKCLSFSAFLSSSSSSALFFIFFVGCFFFGLFLFFLKPHSHRVFDCSLLFLFKAVSSIFFFFCFFFFFFLLSSCFVLSSSQVVNAKKRRKNFMEQHKAHSAENCYPLLILNFSFWFRWTPPNSTRTFFFVTFLLLFWHPQISLESLPGKVIENQEGGILGNPRGWPTKIEENQEGNPRES